MQLALSETFRPYSVAHAAVTVGVTALVIALAWAGRRSTSRRRVDVSMALAALAVWIAVTIWWLLPSQRDVGSSLPLHLCDLAGLVAPLALLTDARWLRALLYFWGIGLSTQAFATPIISEGPALPAFWVFWGSHAAILSLAIYDLAARGYRPAWRDWAFAVTAGLLYVAATFVLNLGFETNYGYTGRTQPDAATVIDHLGPWPWRVLALGAVGTLALTLLMVPWAGSRRTA